MRAKMAEKAPQDGRDAARPTEGTDRDEPVRPLGEIGLQQFAPYLMNRVMGRYNANLREGLRSRDLTTPQMRALAVMAVADGLTVNELAVYTVSEQSTMSRTLDAMETQGLLRRETLEADNRVRRIHLTPEGRALFDEVWPVMWQAFRTLFRDVDEAEYAAFVAVLQKMLRNVREHDF